jgi:DNA-directed RNA polymerase subunit RPC12/RpoP
MTRPPVTTTLGCPRCNARRLSLIGQVDVVVADSEFVRTGDGTVETTSTSAPTVLDGTEHTIGVHCPRCGWEFIGAGWAERLAPVRMSLVR